MYQLLQKLDIDKVYTAFVHTYDKDFSFEGEYHDMWELDIVLEGSAGITSGADIYDCKKWDAIIHPSGVFHSFFANSVEEVTLLTVSFTGVGVERFVPHGRFCLEPFEKALVDEIKNCLPMLDSTGSDCRQMMKNLLELLLLSVGRRRQDVAGTSRDKNAEQFFKTVRFMEQSVDEGISTEDICEKMHICRTQLKEMFKRYTGAGVMKYYNALRVRRATMLMREGKSMAEIATLMHFSSQNYFSYFFKRETGVAPSEYR